MRWYLPYTFFASVFAIYDGDCISSAMQLATIDLKVCRREQNLFG